MSVLRGQYRCEIRTAHVVVVWCICFCEIYLLVRNCMNPSEKILLFILNTITATSKILSQRERERGTSCIIYGTSLLYQGRKHVYTYASDQIIVSQCKDSMPRQMQVERLPMKVFLGTAVRLKWTIIIKFSKAASFFYQ